ncbi:MAG: SAM-dependent methyltransferase [Planctomycetota bacterium]
MHEVSSAEFWANRYETGDAPWDYGQACPVFVTFLDSQRAPPTGTVAFPGCGKGHDLRLFLERGYDATGFDFAIDSDDLPIERLDIFELGARYPDHFDMIVEYTCYCAIDPARRGEYAASLRAALKPGGLLVALLFPMGERPDGPPFGIDESEISGVLAVGMDVLSVEIPPNSFEERQDRERLVLARKQELSS